MCGFVAVVETESLVSPDLLHRMAETIIHRGPDEGGLWVSDDRRVGLAARRLSIIDLRHGHQPMVNDDGSIAIAYNGEVYNHAAVRRELEGLGYRFRTRCDTEAVLRAYEEWGEDMLERLEGMFAFAIWDNRQGHLFIARDRMGKKPLYYAATKRGYIFASEIKALLEHPDISRNVDRQAMAHYLSFLIAPPSGTLFAGIHKLKAAHYARWAPGQTLAMKRWWEPPPRGTIDIGFEEAAEHTLELLRSSVEKRMMSDVPFGVYLSGGVDSSTNVALMAQSSTERVRTFSVAFQDEPALDELGYAREIARHFDTEHREIVVDDGMALASLPLLIHHQDEPIADPVCVPLLHLAKLTKASGVTVVQIGEGSDEIFFGYPVFDYVLRQARRLEWLRMLPVPVARSLIWAAQPLVVPLKHEYLVETVEHGFPPPHGIAGFSEKHKSGLLNHQKYSSAYSYLNAEVGFATRASDLPSVALRHELAVRLSELLLMRVDKMTMAASVEARAPFLDSRLVEFAAAVPFSYHWESGDGKRLLKKAVAGLLPTATIARKKQGFGAPVWRWMRTLGGAVDSYLLRDEMFDYFERGAVRRVVESEPTTRNGFHLWVLLNFALWHRHWIEGVDLRDAPEFAAAATSL